MCRNGLGSLVVIYQLGLLDVQQSGQSLVGGTSHLVVTDGNGSGSLALSVLSGVLTDLTIGIQIDQRSLREQLQVIKEELGEDEDTDDEARQWKEKLDELKLDEKTDTKLRKEIDKFTKMSPMSPDANVSRTYIETILDLPWHKANKINRNINKAEKILNEDHYGLEKVKERILEFLAVRVLTGKGDSPIVCLVGPPGTGKTSIARSVADALGKKYVRICLGGVRDEAEIRGFRDSYNLPCVKNPCPHDGKTRREYVKKLIAGMQKDNPGVKDKMFHAILKGKIYEYDK